MLAWSLCPFFLGFGISQRKDIREKLSARAKGIAHVAQLAEHILGKDEVTGSIPVMG
jgi:hypothetical protein